MVARKKDYLYSDNFIDNPYIPIRLILLKCYI